MEEVADSYIPSLPAWTREVTTERKRNVKSPEPFCHRFLVQNTKSGPQHWEVLCALFYAGT